MPLVSYKTQVLCLEQADSRGLIWQDNTGQDGVAWRVVHGNREVAIYDSVIIANDVRNNLNTVVIKNAART